MADLFLALLHHPVLDKNGADRHHGGDEHGHPRHRALGGTYGVRRFFVVTPVRALRALSRKIIEHWETGFGSTYNATRKEALALVGIETDLDGALVAIERETGERPTIVATSARPAAETIGFDALRQRLAAAAGPYLLVFGTGWGLAPEVLQRADLRLEPVLRADALQPPLGARRGGHHS